MEDATESQKTCGKCGSFGPFSKNIAAKDGLQKYCKACVKIVTQKYYHGLHWLFQIGQRKRWKY